LNSIDVTVSGSRARAYKLSYAMSGSTSRSLLTSVQECGRDALVDGSGNVTGGTCLPATTLGYVTDFAANSVRVGAWIPGWYCRTSSGPDGYDMQVGDFNGDGIADALCRSNSSGDVSVALGTTSGSFATSAVWSPGLCPWGSGGNALSVGDFN